MTHSLESILFLDIETAPISEQPDRMPDALKEIYLEGKTKKKKKLNQKTNKMMMVVKVTTKKTLGVLD